MNMRNKKLRGSLLLLITAMIWGCAFTAQSVAADSVGPWLFNGIRFLMGGIEVLLLAPMLERIQPETGSGNRKKLLQAGITCGLVLIGASVLQQAGIRYTSAGKAGFLTSLYVVLVPVAGLLFLHKPSRTNVWIAAVLAVVALYLLSSPEDGTIGKGELLEFLCAVAFAVHILVIDHTVHDVNAIRFSAVQFLTAGVIGMIGAVLFEPISISAIKEAGIPILYAGLMSAGLGYTLQVLGQKDADPAVASVLMSLESVFSAIFGFLLLHEVLSGMELLGCALMFTAVIISQLE